MKCYNLSASILEILSGLARLRIEITLVPEGRRLGSLNLPGYTGKAYIIIDLHILIWRPIHGYIELT